MTYAEKLRSPMWQRKRLEILKRADFRCEWCGYDEDQLHVHHRYYDKGHEPWEYPDEAFDCLCEPCHHEATVVRQLLKDEVAKIDPRHIREAASRIHDLREEIEIGKHPMPYWEHELYSGSYAATWALQETSLQPKRKEPLF